MHILILQNASGSCTAAWELGSSLCVETGMFSPVFNSQADFRISPRIFQSGRMVFNKVNKQVYKHFYSTSKQTCQHNRLTMMRTLSSTVRGRYRASSVVLHSLCARVTTLAHKYLLILNLWVNTMFSQSIEYLIFSSDIQLQFYKRQCYL